VTAEVEILWFFVKILVATLSSNYRKALLKCFPIQEQQHRFQWLLRYSPRWCAAQRCCSWREVSLKI